MNLNEDGEFNIAWKNSFIKYKKALPGIFASTFSSESFQGLLNLINADPQMFYYYGSETKPPCKEEVLWQVFANPRTISKKQLEFLKYQLIKKSDGSKFDKKVTNKSEVYGNIRAILGLSNERPLIKFNPLGSNGTSIKTN